MPRVGLATLTLLLAACGGGGSQTGTGGTGGGGGSVGGSGTAGAAGGGATGGSAGSGATGGAPTGLLDPARTTTWNPGILADGQLGHAARRRRHARADDDLRELAPGADINAAIDACPEGQVVKLAAGTYTVSSTIKLNKGVVLRGAGSQGARGRAPPSSRAAGELGARNRRRARPGLLRRNRHGRGAGGDGAKEATTLSGGVGREGASRPATSRWWTWSTTAPSSRATAATTSASRGARSASASRSRPSTVAAAR